MEALCALPKAKQQKTVERQGVGENEDRISRLPDCLLHHVLSFLPTKNAAATCVLSKRWLDLWKWVTNLDFECLCSYSREEKWNNSFIIFVERVLLLHSSNIRSFRLRYNGTLDLSRVNSWISAAIRLHVQELDLSFQNKSLDFLPLCLFTSKMLTVLKVTSFFGDLKLPSTICLSSLKTLHLSKVSFVDDISINKLFSSLPVLEELMLDTCGWNNVRNVTISLPSLKRLTLIIFMLIKSGNYRKVRVKAEDLIFLSFNSNLTVDLCLDSMDLLAKALIDVESLVKHSRAADHAANTFRGLCFVKSLDITGRALEFLHHQNPTENVDLFPTFARLTTLTVNSKLTGLGSGILMNIFRKAPVLESVVIAEVFGGKWNAKSIPRCFKSGLRTCNLLIFDGRPAEVLFVKFLLKNADVLERIKLHCSENLCSHPERLESVVNQLGTIHKSSDRCVIEFVDHDGIPKI